MVMDIYTKQVKNSKLISQDASLGSVAFFFLLLVSAGSPSSLPFAGSVAATELIKLCGVEGVGTPAAGSRLNTAFKGPMEAASTLMPPVVNRWPHERPMKMQDEYWMAEKQNIK